MIFRRRRQGDQDAGTTDSEPGVATDAEPAMAVEHHDEHHEHHEHPEGLRPPGEAPHPDDLPTRKRLPVWDRVKYLLLLTLIWFILVWAAMADNPLLPFVDAMREQARAAMWVFVLIGLELIRQIHFLISERWSRYHLFWKHRVFGGWERYTHRRFSDWTRFRLRRAFIWVFWI